MNWLDYLILSVIVIQVLRGAFRGFIRGLFSVIGLIVSIIAAKKYYWLLAELLIQKTGIENALMGFLKKNKVTEAFSFILPADKSTISIYDYATLVIINCLAILLIFIAAMICMIMLETVLDGIFKLPVLNTINHSFGAILGFCKAIFILLFIFAMIIPLSSIEKFSIMYDAIENSLLSKYFYQYNFVFDWAINSALKLIDGVGVI